MLTIPVLSAVRLHSDSEKFIVFFGSAPPYALPASLRKPTVEDKRVAWQQKSYTWTP